MSLEAKVALNWLETTTDDCMPLKSLVDVLEKNPYEVEKHVATCKELTRELIVRFRNVYDVLEQLRDQTTQDGDAAPELRELLGDFVLAVHRFREFLKRFNQEHFLYRLVRNEKMVDAIQQAHDEVDDFVDGVQRSRFGVYFNHLAIVADINADVLNRSDAEWRDLVSSSSRALKRGVDARDPAISILLEGQPVSEARMKAAYTLMYEWRRITRRETASLLVAVATEQLSEDFNNVKLMPWFIPSDDIIPGEKFASGGFGVVFRGKLGRATRVVIKRMIKFDEKVLMREIGIWYQLKHPHILQLYGATHLDSTCSIVSEDAAHGQLGRYWVSRLTPSIDAERKKHLWRFFYEAALGLHYMHQLGYVHGDLKCDNILIGDDLKAKLADFGLSFKNGDHEDVPCSAASHWAAPECLDKTRRTERSFPTDVYMLGMCIVEALIGGPPYGNLINPAAGRFVRQGTLPETVSKLAPQVQELVKAMCELKPADRMKLEDVIATLKQFADANDPDLLLVSA